MAPSAQLSVQPVIPDRTSSLDILVGAKGHVLWIWLLNRKNLNDPRGLTKVVWIEIWNLPEVGLPINSACQWWDDAVQAHSLAHRGFSPVLGRACIPSVFLKGGYHHGFGQTNALSYETVLHYRAINILNHIATNRYCQPSLLWKPETAPSISKCPLGLQHHLWLRTTAVFTNEAHLYKYSVFLPDKNNYCSYWSIWHGIKKLFFLKEQHVKYTINAL